MNNQDPKRILTGKVRLSYVHILKPRATEQGGALKYGVTLLIPKSDVATRQKIDAAIALAIQEAIPTKWGGTRPAQPATPIHDGDGLKVSGEPFGEECRGHWVMTASTPDRPEVVDLNLNPILNATEIYSGMYARVTVKFFGYANTGKKGIGCALGNIQKLADGEPLAGNAASAADDFGGAQPVAPTYPQYGQAPNINIYPQQPMPPAYPQQPVAPAPAYGYPPIQPQYPQPSYPAPAPQVDPITGRPLVGPVMGL